MNGVVRGTCGMGLAVCGFLAAVLLSGCGGGESSPSSPASPESSSAASTVSTGAGEALPPAPVTAPAFEQSLSPSDATQTIACGEGVSLTLPPNAVAAEALLRVSRVTEPAPLQVAGMTLLGAWDFSLGDKSTFAQPVTVEMAYDPSALAADVPLEAQLYHVWYMPEVKGWGFGPVEVDAERHVARFQTKHFSGHGLAVSPQARQFPGLRVTIDKGFTKVPSWATATRATTPEQYRDIVVKELTAAGKALAGASLARFPTKQIEVVIGSWGLDETSQWSIMSGNVYIIADYQDFNELKHDCAHELFHAVQNEFLRADLMLSCRWYIEAAADMAADTLVFPGLGHAGRGINETFLSRSITYDPDSKDRHKYHLMHFLKRVSQKGAARLAADDPTITEGVYFTRLWNASVASGESVTVTAIDGALKTTSGGAEGLLDAYSDFALYFLFDAKSPMPQPSHGKMNPGATEDAVVMEADPDAEVTHTFRFGPSEHYTARVWAVRSKMPDNAPGRALSVELDGELPTGMRVYAVHLPGNVRPAGGVKPIGAYIESALNYRPATLQMKENDGLYIVAIWSSFIEESVSVKVKAVPVEITEIVPPAAAVGEEVVINGRGFGPDPMGQAGRLLMGKRDIISSKVSWTDTEIRMKVPAGAVPGGIVVTNNEVRSNAMPLDVIVPPWPDGLFELRHGNMDNVSLPNPLFQIAAGKITVLHERTRKQCGQGTVAPAKDRRVWTDPVYDWNVEFTHEYRNADGPVQLKLAIKGGKMQLTGTAAMKTGEVPVDVWANLVPAK